MSNDDYSCVEEVKKTVHISLPLSFCGNEVAGVKDALESWKSQYVEHLGGILLDYKNVSLSPVGSVVYDLLCSHYDVSASFFVFKPRCGSILKGIVNRISKTHVGCIVHGYINVSIHLSPNIAHEVTKFLLLDSEILFQVTHVDAQRRVIRVKGEITSECIKLMGESLPGWNKGKHRFFDDDLIDDLDCPDSGISVKKIKKHKKKQHLSDDNSTSGFESLNHEQEGTQLSLPTKEHKKKRKRKEICEESLFTSTGLPDFDNSHIYASTPFEMPHKKIANSGVMTNTSFLDYVASSAATENFKKNSNVTFNNMNMPDTGMSNSQSVVDHAMNTTCRQTGIENVENTTPKEDSQVKQKKNKRKLKDEVSKKLKDKTKSSKSKHKKNDKSEKSTNISKRKDKNKLLKSKKEIMPKNESELQKTMDFDMLSEIKTSELPKGKSKGKGKSSSKDKVSKSKRKSSKLKSPTKTKVKTKNKGSDRKSEKRSKKHKHKSKNLQAEISVENNVKNEI